MKLNEFVDEFKDGGLSAQELAQQALEIDDAPGVVEAADALITAEERFFLLLQGAGF